MEFLLFRRLKQDRRQVVLIHDLPVLINNFPYELRRNKIPKLTLKGDKIIKIEYVPKIELNHDSVEGVISDNRLTLNSLGKFLLGFYPN